MLPPVTLAANSDADPGVIAVRVCVIDSVETGAVYPRLAECTGVEVIGNLPWLDAGFVPRDLVQDLDVVVVGGSAEQLRDAAFQAQLLKLTRRARVIVVTSGPADYAAVAQLGVRGLVGREVEPLALDRVIRAVAKGEIAFPRGALSALFRLIGKSPLRAGATLPLTPRQQEVVSLIAGGATDREVAMRLRISESTAHKHVQNALRRSRARTRSQLVALVRQDAVTSI